MREVDEKHWVHRCLASASLSHSKALSYNLEVKGRDCFASFPPTLFTVVKAFLFYIPTIFIHEVKTLIR